MKLVVGWTLVGGFVFTLVVTCLSLVGLVKFANPAQQRMLFKVLVIEIVVGAGGKVLGALRFDAGKVGDDVYAEGALAGGAAVGEALIANLPATDAVETSREAVLGAVEALRLPESSDANRMRAELVEGLRAAPDRETLSRSLLQVKTRRIDPR